MNRFARGLTAAPATIRAIIPKWAACAAILLALIAGSAHADLDAARKALNDNDYKRAISALDAVIADSPNNVQARFYKGLALARSGDDDGAIKVFEALSKDQPDMYEVWNNLGVLRARENDLAGAQKAFDKAIGINPQYGPAHENLGDIHVALAEQAYRRAGDVEPDNGAARAKARQLAQFIDDSGGDQAASSKSSSAGSGDTGSNAGASATEKTPSAGSGDAATDAGALAAGKTPSAGSDDTAADAGAPAADASRQASADDKKGEQSAANSDDDTPKATVRRWAAAWSAQDVERYLSMYADDFKPGDDMSRAAWADQRRDRVGSPARIEVTISNLSVKRRGDQALALFDQRYRSDRYQDRERKALLLGKTAQGWRILREGRADAVDFTSGADADSARSEPAQDRDAAAAASPDQTGSAGGREAQRSAPAEMQAESRRQSARRGVRNALLAWAKAWSNQNLQAYLNAYSDNYRPQGDESRVDWIRKRRAAVSRPAWIKVELSDIRVDLLGAKRAQARFDQHYRSDRYEDRERKHATLLREDGGWRILRES